MYGLIFNVVESLILEEFGLDILEKIKSKAGLSEVTTFLTHEEYKEDYLIKLVKAASGISGISEEILLEKTGRHFFEYCKRIGHATILQSLGHDLLSFMSNLDALHDHLSYTYPNMLAPSFRCDPVGNDSHTMLLHYYSARKGFEYVVIGIVKAVAKDFHGTNVTLEIIQREELERYGGKLQHHVVFKAIEEKLCLAKDETSNVALKKGRKKSLFHDSSTLSMGLDDCSMIPKTKVWPITPEVFGCSFPFHLIFDANLEIVSVGKALKRLLPSLKPKGAHITEYFAITRPQIPFAYDTIRSFENSKFTLAMKNGEDTSQISFKGQMIFLNEANQFLFLGSPQVHYLEQMNEKGLFLSDFPLHDSARDLVMINSELKVEKKIALMLEQTKAELEREKGNVLREKERADSLLHAMLPVSVAEELQMGRVPEAMDHPVVTVLFSDIKGFTSICNSCQPIQVVKMLNRLYTLFDELTGKHNVYKVETIGDAYMVAAGLLQTATRHAEALIQLGFDMRYVSEQVVEPNCETPLQIRIGVHSGPVVSGVVGTKMPRYCLFGDTVNTASRMESHGMPGKVHISQKTFEQIKDKGKYLFESRGALMVKGLGQMVTYFVEPRQGKETEEELIVTSEFLASRPTPTGQEVTSLSRLEQKEAKLLSRVCVIL